MTNIQNEISARVDAFVAEITELARQAAYDTLSGALSQAGIAAVGGRAPRRTGGKRTPAELEQMAEAFLAHVAANPGQRMEQISKALGYRTAELHLPVRKLVAAGQVAVEGQKRATQYHPAGGKGTEVGEASKPKRSKAAKSSGVRVRRRKGKGRRKKA